MFLLRNMFLARTFLQFHLHHFPTEYVLKLNEALNLKGISADYNKPFIFIQFNFAINPDIVVLLIQSKLHIVGI